MWNTGTCSDNKFDKLFSYFNLFILQFVHNSKCQLVSYFKISISIYYILSAGNLKTTISSDRPVPKKEECSSTRILVLTGVTNKSYWSSSSERQWRVRKLTGVSQSEYLHPEILLLLLPCLILWYEQTFFSLCSFSFLIWKTEINLWLFSPFLDCLDSSTFFFGFFSR